MAETCMNCAKYFSILKSINYRLLFVLREKITHFDHERIPERIVHARGSGAHGYFQPTKSLAKFTKAAFLQDPKKKTEV